MNRSPTLRRLFWIGWVVWVFVALSLLMRFPVGLPFVDWTFEDSMLTVTWLFAIFGIVVIFLWPLVVRPIRFIEGLVVIGRGIVKGLYELVMALPFIALLVGWAVLFKLLTPTPFGLTDIPQLVLVLAAFIFSLFVFVKPLRADDSSSPLSRLRSTSRFLTGLGNNPLFFITWAVLLVGWQVASYVAPPGTLAHPLVPGWDYVFSVALPRMAGDWYLPGGFPLPGVTLLFDRLAPFPAIMGEEARTWPAVFLALAFHSFMTLSRLVLGLSLGLLSGIATGLVISYWSVLRQISWTPMNYLRMLPLLAAIPWMQVALGATLRGLTTFIAFGVWVVLVVATMNSVSNVPDRYIESARTLGASRLRTYFKVIIPGSMPELRTALLLSAGLGWSLTIAAEFLGFPTGLGYMASIAVQETNTARLVVVAIVVAIYSLLTFYFLNEMFKKAVSWMPQRTGQTDISKVAGAAGAARAETIHEA